MQVGSPWRCVPGAVALLVLCACGEMAQSSDTSPTGAGSGGAAASGGAAGRDGAIGGVPAAGGAAGSPSLDVSAAWTWNECGRIPARNRPAFPISSLAMSDDGQLLVSNDGSATAWRVADAFGDSEPLWTHGGEGAYNTDVSRDGRLVAVSGDLRLVYDARDGTRLVLPEIDPSGTIPSARPATWCASVAPNESVDHRPPIAQPVFGMPASRRARRRQGGAARQRSGARRGRMGASAESTLAFWRSATIVGGHGVVVASTAPPGAGVGCGTGHVRS